METENDISPINSNSSHPSSPDRYFMHDKRDVGLQGPVGNIYNPDNMNAYHTAEPNRDFHRQISSILAHYSYD